VIVRRFQSAPDDLPALTRLLAEIPEFAESGEDYSEEALRAQAELMPGFEPERDRWVVESPGEPERLVGFASLFLFPGSPRADLQLGVHPDWRQRGLGSALLRLALAGARARGVADANVYINETDTGAAAFARAQGFTPHSAYTRLAAPGVTNLLAPAFPTGYIARACRGDEDYSLEIEGANTCYGDLWGHNPVTEELGHDWFASQDPSGICFVFDSEGALVGRSSAQIVARGGELNAVIDAPGVVPAHRRLGLYVPLLLWEIAWSDHASTVPITRYLIESWGDDPATIAAYQASGFAIDVREVAWRLAL
jgi:GNAT superfamily N-acetyltransferase